MVRKGKPANFTKVRDAIKNARSLDEVYTILEVGRFNLTGNEERAFATEWERTQEILAEHNKGVYAPFPVEA